MIPCIFFISDSLFTLGWSIVVFRNIQCIRLRFASLFREIVRSYFCFIIVYCVFRFTDGRAIFGCCDMYIFLFESDFFSRRCFGTLPSAIVFCSFELWFRSSRFLFCSVTSYLTRYAICRRPALELLCGLPYVLLYASYGAIILCPKARDVTGPFFFGVVTYANVFFCWDEYHMNVVSL